MSDKVLIQQVFVNDGFLFHQTNDSEDRDFILDTCMPSIRNYSERHGYDYKVCVDIPEIIENMPLATSNPAYMNMRLGFIRYLQLKEYENYDYIVLYDADVLMMNNAPEQPLLPGVTTRHIDYYRIHEIDCLNRRILSNAGWYIFDKFAAKTMYEWVLKRIPIIIKEAEEAIIPYYFHDEYELAKMMDCHLDIPHNDVGDKWNHCQSLHIAFPYVPPKFAYHFVGGLKKLRYDSLVDDGWIDTNNNYISTYGL